MEDHADDLAPLGRHDGLPILSQKLIINKTGDGLSKSVDIAPRHIDTDEESDIAGRIRHRKRRFDNVYTNPDKDSDDPPKLKGVIQVDIYEAVAIVFDDREATGKLVDRTLGKIADKEDQEKQAKGQLRLKGVKPVPDDDEDAGEPAGE